MFLPGIQIDYSQIALTRTLDSRLKRAGMTAHGFTANMQSKSHAAIVNGSNADQH
jgi:hypothetical protein